MTEIKGNIWQLAHFVKDSICILVLIQALLCNGQEGQFVSLDQTGRPSGFDGAAKSLTIPSERNRSPSFIDEALFAFEGMRIQQRYEDFTNISYSLHAPVDCRFSRSMARRCGKYAAKAMPNFIDEISIVCPETQLGHDNTLFAPVASRSSEETNRPLAIKESGEVPTEGFVVRGLYWYSLPLDSFKMGCSHVYFVLLSVSVPDAPSGYVKDGCDFIVAEPHVQQRALFAVLNKVWFHTSTVSMGRG